MKESKHIIIVDDDLAIQDALQMMLKPKGYSVTTLTSGTPLLEPGFRYPDLFILDKQLPGMDGLDICRHLKSQQNTQHIPVLILSASPQVGISAKAAGADDFLEKPFKMKDLRELIERLLQ